VASVRQLTAIIALTLCTSAAAAKQPETQSVGQLLDDQKQAENPLALDDFPGQVAGDEGHKPVEDRRDRIFYPGGTERAKPLLKKLFLNIVLDQEDIFTSPFHINRHNALEWLVPTAATGGLIAADTHIANAFENSRGQVRWGGRISNIGASYTLIPIVAGSYSMEG
jgi:hypothetical protein